MTIRIFLLDDHEIVQRGLREVFEAQEDLEVVGEASNAEEAMMRVPPPGPTLPCSTCACRVPAELRFAATCGRPCRSFGASCSRRSPTTTPCSRPYWPGQRLPPKADQGYRACHRRPAGGGGPVPHRPALTAGVLDRLRGKHDDERIAKLSPQERRILNLIAEGMTNRQIGAELYLAEKTVKNYVSNLLAKMGFSRRTEAAVYAPAGEERSQVRGVGCRHDRQPEPDPSPERHRWQPGRAQGRPRRTRASPWPPPPHKLTTACPPPRCLSW